MRGEHDFLMEKRLRALDPDLHRRVTDAALVLQHTLSHYQRLFPEFTDHTLLHSMSVINFCNALIGRDQIERLNADELYVLLMGCYLHDVGMSVSERDYEAFRREIDTEAYFLRHPGATRERVVRDFHHEFSALFIRKYAELFDIPTREHLFCIVQIARGHRRTNLFDPDEYPAAYRLPNGHTVCLPYLSALIRLADEIDVTAERNPSVLYDIEALTDEHEIYFSRLNEAVPMLHIDPEGFTMDVKTDDDRIYAGLLTVREKMQETLDLCRSVAAERTEYRITQKWVNLRRIA